MVLQHKPRAAPARAHRHLCLLHSVPPRLLEWEKEFLAPGAVNTMAWFSVLNQSPPLLLHPAAWPLSCCSCPCCLTDIKPAPVGELPSTPQHPLTAQAGILPPAGACSKTQASRKLIQGHVAPQQGWGLHKWHLLSSNSKGDVFNRVPPAPRALWFHFNLMPLRKCQPGPNVGTNTTENCITATSS